MGDRHARTSSMVWMPSVLLGEPVKLCLSMVLPSGVFLLRYSWGMVGRWLLRLGLGSVGDKEHICAFARHSSGTFDDGQDERTTQEQTNPSGSKKAFYHLQQATQRYRRLQ
jgi:hypothetical protein